MVKIAALGIVGILCALFVKEMKAPYGTLISLAVCILLFFFSITKLEYLTDAMGRIEDYISLDSSYIKVLLKIIGITYLADFSSNLCKDAGYSAVAGQIEVFGKLAILGLGMPMLLALLDTVQAFLG